MQKRLIFGGKFLYGSGDELIMCRSFLIINSMCGRARLYLSYIYISFLIKNRLFDEKLKKESILISVCNAFENECKYIYYKYTRNFGPIRARFVSNILLNVIAGSRCLCRIPSPLLGHFLLQFDFKTC